MTESNKTEKVSNLLAGIFRERNWESRIRMHAVFDFWNEAVGSEIAAKTCPQVIRGKVLWVNVSDSVWMQQLHFQKIMLLEQINKRLGKEKIEDIRYHLDTRLDEFSETKSPQKAHSVWPLDPVRVKEFEKMIAGVDDDGLKKSLKRLWTKFEKTRYLKR
jgi:predicted nucleic acid-binding Zn ribbon protein